LIEDEIYDNIKPLAAKVQNLIQKPQPVSFQYHNLVHTFTILHKFRVRLARENNKPQLGRPSLQCPENRKRDDHVSDAVESEDEHPLYSSKVERLFDFRVPEEAPKKRVHNTLSE